MLVLKRKHKLLITALVSALVILSTPLTNYRLHERFLSSRSRSPFFPTLSSSQKLNLKKPQQGLEHSVDDLRVQLDFHFPYDSKAKIPRRIWQTWRDDLGSAAFPSSFRTYLQAWDEESHKDPEYTYDHVFLSDGEIPVMLQSLYGAIPAVLEAFNALPLPIMKADFFRYLILYARGGIYSDIDTIPCKPLSVWPSTNPSFLHPFTKNNIKYGKGLESGSNVIPEPGLIVGIEADPNRPDWAEHYARRIQFCQWTIQSKPGHPLLRELILNITASTLYSTSERSNVNGKFTPIYDEEHLEDYNVNYRSGQSSPKDTHYKLKKNRENTDVSEVMNWTGPAIFSDTIFAYINNIVKMNKDIVIFNDNLMQPASNPENEQEEEESTLKFYSQITQGLYSQSPQLSWEFFSFMKTPILIDDIVILPITSFSPGVGHMGAKGPEDDLALVQHIFKGSWKD